MSPKACARSVVVACVALAACDPVLLDANSGHVRGSGTQAPAKGRTPDASTSELDDLSTDAEPPASDSSGAPDAGDVSATPDVILSLKSIECGSCFDLSARGNGGVPPYRYEWEDGSSSDSRRVCVGGGVVHVWVVAEDSSHARSQARIANLQSDTVSGEDCSQDVEPSSLCLLNLSFEGTAALNTGGVFDAEPWSDCVDPTLASSATTPNTPDIVSDTLDPASGIAPMPKQGATYLALSPGEQTSQTLCSPLSARSKSNLQLDALRFDLGGPDMYLQLWGGDSSSCSQSQLLWVSPALNTTWQTYCVPIAPSDLMDQITLRAESPMAVANVATSYLAVDNLIAVSECP